MKKVKILIVEDEAVQAEMLRRILVNAGFDVFTANDGQEALKVIPTISPSVVISDILMPVIDGYEMCRQIKFNENLQDIFVILLTELKDPTDIIKGLEAKADSYITKPFDKNHLIHKINNIFERTPVKKQKSSPHTIMFGNESHTITSSYQEIFDLLIDTYENVIQQNKELTKRTGQLKESEERFKFLVQSVPDIIYKIDPDGRFTFVNDSIRKLGYEPQELIGRHFSEIILKEDIDLVSRDKVLSKLKGKTTGDNEAPRLFDERRSKDRFSQSLEVRIVAKESRFIHPGLIEPIGSDTIFTEVNSFGIHQGQPDENSLQFKGTLGVISNKTKQFVGTTGVIRDLSERKKIEDALLSDKGFLENILGHVTNGVFVFNPQGTILLVNKSGANICDYDVNELIEGHYSKIFSSSKFEDFFNKLLHKSMHIIDEETEIVQKNGNIRSITFSLIPIYFEGRIVNIVATVDDITERKLSQEALLLSEEKFRGMSSFATDGIIMIDDLGLITYWNKAAEKIFGYKGNEIINTNLHELIMPKKYQEVFNDGFKRFKETGSGKLIGTTVEMISLNKDGTEFPVEISLSSINIKNKWHAIGIVRDITKRKVIENTLNELNLNLQQMVQKEVEAHRQKDIMLIQQSKMAAMGEMIGVIAHQWKQPLNALSLIVQDIQDAYAHNELDEKYIGNIIEQSLSQIEFMARTIDDFRNFFSPSKESVQFFIVESINEIYNIIIGQLKKLNIKVTLLCKSGNSGTSQNIVKNDFWEIATCKEANNLQMFGYQNEFKQVILNLLTNAMDAIVNRREKEKDINVGKIDIKLNKIDKDIIIEISDNGGGIPSEIIQSIFDPYFTTKSEKKGTGIGLYMSKSIIENSMKGKISVQNKEEGASGAVFTLIFNSMIDLPHQ